MASKRSSGPYTWQNLVTGERYDFHDWETMKAFLKTRDPKRPVRDALVALWTDRRSDKHAELYAAAMAALNEWEPQETC